MGNGSVLLQRPDSFGRFGKFGGKYVPETLMHALTELEAAFYSLSADEEFQVLSLKTKTFDAFVLCDLVGVMGFVCLLDWILGCVEWFHWV